MGTITGSLDIKAGTGSIEIEHTGLPTTTMEIVDISDFGVSYDLEDKSESADTVFFTPSKFDFSVFDALANGDSLFNEIDAIISTDEITARLNFTTDGGHSWTDTFTFHSGDMEFDHKQRITKIKGKISVTLATETIQNIFDANPAQVQTIKQSPVNSGPGYTSDCMWIPHFMENALNVAAPAATPIISLNTFGMGGFDGTPTWVVMADVNLSETSPAWPHQRTSAEDMLYILAALDGSFVGAIMGYSFIIGRTNTDNVQTLLPKDVLSLDLKPSVKNYLFISVGAETLPVVSPTLVDWNFLGTKYGTVDGLNDAATKTLNIYFLVNGFWPATWDATDSTFYDRRIGNSTTKITETSDTIPEGSYSIPAKADPGLTPGDTIAFGASFWFTVIDYYVFSHFRDGSIYIASPLKRETGANVDINHVDPTWSMAGSVAADNYAKAYGADGSKLIELTINDVDKVKPYEVIELTGGFGYGLNNKIFRPSEIKYDLQKDTIKIRAYEI